MREVLIAYCKMKSRHDLQKKKYNIISIRDLGIDEGQNNDVTAVKLHPFARDTPEWLGEFIKDVRIVKKLLKESCLF